MPRSCVPDIDVMDPQALDPVDMDGKCLNPHEAVKEALTTKTAGARANPTLSAGGTVPRSSYLLDRGNGIHDRAKVSATKCSSVDSVKKVLAKGTSGKDMDVGYDPLVRSVDPSVQESDYKCEGIGAPVETIEAGGHELRQGFPILSSIEGKCTDLLLRSIQPDEQGSNLKCRGIGAPLDTGTGLNPTHLGVGMGKGIKGDRGVGFHRGNKESASETTRTDGVTQGVPPSAAGYENLGRPVRHGGQILDLQFGSSEVMGLEINHAQLGSQEGGGQVNHVQQYIAKYFLLLLMSLLGRSC